MTKKEILKKLEYYTKEITKEKPWFDTVFRIYYDSLLLVNKIIYHINENPWHPQNDYRDEIFQSITECFEKLEQIKLKSQKKQNDQDEQDQ